MVVVMKEALWGEGGRTLEEAFASAGLGMYNYMTPLSDVAIDPACTRCAVKSSLITLLTVVKTQVLVFRAADEYSIIIIAWAALHWAV